MGDRSLGRVSTFAVAALLSLVLAGCGTRERVVVERESYEKLPYETAEVKKGNLTPKMTLTLYGEGTRAYNYRAAVDGLKMERICVSVGDRVKKGDLLITFCADDVKKRLKSYKKKIRENNLLISHYKKLAEIDPSQDYTEELKSLKQEIRVARLYREELEGELEDYEIRARADGVITEINDRLKVNQFKMKTVLMTEVSGSGEYTADAKEDCSLTVGKRYRAKSGDDMCDMKFTGEKKDKNGKKLLSFQAEAGITEVSGGKSFSIEIKRKEIRDVVYVDSNALFSRKGKYFVYCLDESGYRDVMWVTPGEQAGDYTVIKEGLSGGETVTLVRGEKNED